MKSFGCDGIDNETKSVRNEVFQVRTCFLSLPVRVSLVCLFNRHDLLDLHELLLLLDQVKNGEGSADMEAIDSRRMGIIEFFFISSRKRIMYQFMYFVNDDSSGFYRDLFKKFPGSLLDDDGKHDSSPVLIILHDLFGVKGHKLAVCVDLCDHLPVTIIPFALYHHGDQFIKALSCLFQVVKTSPGGFFHRDPFNPGFTRAGRHAHIWISMVFIGVAYAPQCALVPFTSSTEKDQGKPLI